MPWSLSKRDGKWCVVKDSDGSVEGCHSSRTDAIKQQRALYSSESRMASMYAELDALEETPEELVAEASVEDVKAAASELVKIEIGKENEALTASLMERMDAMSKREQETHMALVAALHAIGTREPVVNVESPPPANVTVEAAPPAEVKVDVHVPEQPTPSVSVNPEIVLPSETRTKTITFERDFEGRVTKADVVEETE